jgi:hypothetical protein
MFLPSHQPLLLLVLLALLAQAAEVVGELVEPLSLVRIVTLIK